MRYIAVLLSYATRKLLCISYSIKRSAWIAEAWVRKILLRKCAARENKKDMHINVDEIYAHALFN